MSLKDLKKNTGSDVYAKKRPDHSKSKTTIKGNNSKKNDAN